MPHPHLAKILWLLEKWVQSTYLDMAFGFAHKKILIHFLTSIGTLPFLLLKYTKHCSHWKSGDGFSGCITWSLYLCRYQCVLLCSISPHNLHTTLPSLLIMYSNKSCLALGVSLFSTTWDPLSRLWLISSLFSVKKWTPVVLSCVVVSTWLVSMLLLFNCGTLWSKVVVIYCSGFDESDRTSKVMTGMVLSTSSSYM